MKTFNELEVRKDDNRTPQDVPPQMQDALYNLLYDDFLYDRTKPAWIKVIQTAQPVKPLGFMSYDTITDNKGILSHYDGSVRNVFLEISGFKPYGIGLLIGPDGTKINTDIFLASLNIMTAKEINDTDNKGYAVFKQFESVGFRLVPQKYSTKITKNNICNVEDKIYIETSLIKPTSIKRATVDSHIGINPNTEINDKTFFVCWLQRDNIKPGIEKVENIEYQIEYQFI